jgi:hypothetical protein
MLHIVQRMVVVGHMQGHQISPAIRRIGATSSSDAPQALFRVHALFGRAVPGFCATNPVDPVDEARPLAPYSVAHSSVAKLDWWTAAMMVVRWDGT